MADAIMKNEFGDEKVYIVNRLLSEGKDKYEAARAVGYRDASGFDKYAKKLGYSWNVLDKCYTLCGNKEIPKVNFERVDKVLRLISDGKKLDDIAKYFKMKNSQELAEYMKERGYIWSVDKGNYIKKSMVINERKRIQLVNDKVSYLENCNSEKEDVDIVKFLESNKDKLIELLSYKNEKVIPRHNLKGILITKSFYISTDIDRVLKDFSRDKSISQKDIIHTALIEYFEKYGYSNEASRLVQS